jgi:hypothetical protein
MMKIYFLVKNHQNIPSFSRQKLEIWGFRKNKQRTLDGHRVFVEDVSYIEGEAKSDWSKIRSSNVKVVQSIFEHFSYDKNWQSIFCWFNQELPRGTGDSLRIKKSSTWKRIIIFF